MGALIALKVWRLLSEKAATYKKLTWGRNCQKLLTFAPQNFLPHSTSTVRFRPHGKTPLVPKMGQRFQNLLDRESLFSQRPERLKEAQGPSESVKSLSEVSGNKEAKLDGVERISRSRNSSHWIFPSPSFSPLPLPLIDHKQMSARKLMKVVTQYSKWAYVVCGETG